MAPHGTSSRIHDRSLRACGLPSGGPSAPGRRKSLGPLGQGGLPPTSPTFRCAHGETRRWGHYCKVLRAPRQKNQYILRPVFIHAAGAMPAFGPALQSHVRIEQTPSLCVLRVPLPPGPPLPLLPLPITSRVLGSSGFESAVPSGGVGALSEGTAWAGLRGGQAHAAT